jgi:hypothetical protein
MRAMAYHDRQEIRRDAQTVRRFVSARSVQNADTIEHPDSPSGLPMRVGLHYRRMSK